MHVHGPVSTNGVLMCRATYAFQDLSNVRRLAIAYQLLIFSLSKVAGPIWHVDEKALIPVL